jgi:hypothetical protein
MAAAAYGADHTWFLVQGSTVGIQVNNEGSTEHCAPPSAAHVSSACCSADLLPCLPDPQCRLMAALCIPHLGKLYMFCDGLPPLSRKSVL